MFRIVPRNVSRWKDSKNLNMDIEMNNNNNNNSFVVVNV